MNSSLDDSPKGENGGASNTLSDNLILFTRNIMVLISWTLKFTQHKSHCQKHHCGTQKWQMCAICLVFPAMPVADSTNRSQNPQSPDVVRNQFQQGPHCSHYQMTGLKPFSGNKTFFSL